MYPEFDLMREVETDPFQQVAVLDVVRARAGVANAGVFAVGGVVMDTQDWVPPELLAQAAGSGLRRVRDEKELTRDAVVARLPFEMSGQTLLSYENGRRQCTLVRYIQICWALGEEPPEMLGVALQEAKIEIERRGMMIDLRAVLDDESAEFEPLRRWARRRLASESGAGGVVRLSRAVIQEMAFIFDYSKSALASHLANFAPRSASG